MMSGNDNLRELEIARAYDNADKKTLELIVGMLKSDAKAMSFRFYLDHKRYEMYYEPKMNAYIIKDTSQP